MPELPEVETVVRDLSKIIEGTTVLDIEAPYPKIIQDDFDDFLGAFQGHKIIDIERFGKYILILFDNDRVMRVHLRMEGKFYLTDAFDTPDLDKHVHVIFTLDNGKYLKYHDVRKFGTMENVAYQEDWHDDSKFKTLGYEPWDKRCTAKYIYDKTQKSRTTIKAFLLNQKTIVGLGNIYVDEVLFRVKMHPETVANTITMAQAKQLGKAAQDVMQHAIALGGTTIRTYHSTLGIDGLFQNELQVHLQKDEACPNCGTKIIKEKVSGRGTYYCPKCQKMEK